MGVTAEVKIGTGSLSEVDAITNLDSRGYVSVQMDNGTRWTVQMSNDGRLRIRLVDGPLASGLSSVAIYPQASNSIEIGPGA